MFTKTLKRTEDLCIEFTEEELAKLNIKAGDKFSCEIDGDGILLKKFVSLDIDISEWSRDVLETLVILSLEQDLPVNDVICNIIENAINTLECTAQKI